MALIMFWIVIAVIVGFGCWLGRCAIATPDTRARGGDGWPVELQHAMDMLGNPLWAMHIWQSIGLGSINTGWPSILEITRTAVGAQVSVLTVTGQAPGDWSNHTAELAAAFAVDEVRIVDTGRGVIEMNLRVYDPLVAGVLAMVPAGSVDLEAVVAGRTEDGGWWRVPVLYRHLLAAGASGSGKSGVLWSIISGMAPAIRDGLVELWAIDPKRVELAPGRALFTHYAAGIDETVLALLNELIIVMDQRLDRMSTTGLRKHIPTVDEPAIVLAVDEVLVLTVFADKEFGKEVDRLLRHLMSLGRAAAVSLILLGQDPSKEIMAWRQMATWRIALRMDEKTQTRMVLGDAATDQGVDCCDISDTTPGVAWVGEEGRTGFVRVRAFEVTDADITTLSRLYAPIPRPVDLTAFDATNDTDPDEADGRNAA